MAVSKLENAKRLNADDDIPGFLDSTVANLTNLDGGEPSEDVEEEQDDLDEDVEADEEEGSEEESEVGESESDEDEEKPKKKTQAKTKETAAIIALKRENKKLAEQNRLLAQQQEQRQREVDKQTLKAKYVNEGWEEDVAERNAESDIRIQTQEARVAKLEFWQENADILSQYPDSKKDTARIMKAVANGGLTVEEACRAFYETDSNFVRRTKAAVRGELQDYSDNPVSRATRSNAEPRSAGLSARDRAGKAALEEMVQHKVTEKQYLIYKDKYGL